MNITKIFAVGDGSSGQTAIGSYDNSDKPEPIALDFAKYKVLDIIETMGAFSFLVAINLKTGKRMLLGSGSNNYKVFGSNFQTKVDVFTEVCEMPEYSHIVGGECNIAVIIDNVLYFAGDVSYFETKPPKFAHFREWYQKFYCKVVKMVAGNEHYMFLLEDGTACGTGYNPYGQLGNNAMQTIGTLQLVQSLYVDIFCGPYTTFFVDTEGRLLACGRNDQGCLGVGLPSNVSVPTLVKIPPNCGRPLFVYADYTKTRVITITSKRFITKNGAMQAEDDAPLGKVVNARSTFSVNCINLTENGEVWFKGPMVHSEAAYKKVDWQGMLLGSNEQPIAVARCGWHFFIAVGNRRSPLLQKVVLKKFGFEDIVIVH